jgi:hypothetical protein
VGWNYGGSRDVEDRIAVNGDEENVAERFPCVGEWRLSCGEDIMRTSGPSGVVGRQNPERVRIGDGYTMLDVLWLFLTGLRRSCGAS